MAHTKGSVSRARSQARKTLTTRKPKRLASPTPLMARFLGVHGIERLRQFMTYESGWDFGRGKAFSRDSLWSFEIFLEHLGEVPASGPSVFLNREGCVELGWEDKNGKAIEVGCFPDRFEYLLAATGAEGELPVCDVDSLIEMIRGLDRSDE